ncbi:DUF4158 domain-containing protein [Streptomyces sp. NPDC005279]|uniref:DUF4158 domain-containing protein n=1 Tax=Streptomyces sp. NPDC005279 TaxID=3364712 RepID=UPI00367B0275
MLTIVWGPGWVVTSIEWTAYPRFKRLITAHELHLFFSPTRDELQWASNATDCDEHLLALLLKSYQRMGCFPKLEDVPDMVAHFVRHQVELPEGTARRSAGLRLVVEHPDPLAGQPPVVLGGLHRLVHRQRGCCCGAPGGGQGGVRASSRAASSGWAAARWGRAAVRGAMRSAGSS